MKNPYSLVFVSVLQSTSIGIRDSKGVSSVRNICLKAIHQFIFQDICEREMSHMQWDSRDYDDFER